MTKHRQTNHNVVENSHVSHNSTAESNRHVNGFLVQLRYGYHHVYQWLVAELKCSTILGASPLTLKQASVEG